MEIVKIYQNYWTHFIKSENLELKHCPNIP